MTEDSVTISCNIHEFLEWLNDVFKKRSYTTKKLEELADIFIAYCSHLSSQPLYKDTKEYRKHWYNNVYLDMMHVSLQKSGF